MVAAIVLWMIFAVISMKDYLIYFNELNNWNRAMFLLVFIMSFIFLLIINYRLKTTLKMYIDIENTYSYYEKVP